MWSKLHNVTPAFLNRYANVCLFVKLESFLRLPTIWKTISTLKILFLNLCVLAKYTTLGWESNHRESNHYSTKIFTLRNYHNFSFNRPERLLENRPWTGGRLFENWHKRQLKNLHTKWFHTLKNFIHEISLLHSWSILDRALWDISQGVIVNGFQP